MFKSENLSITFCPLPSSSPLPALSRLGEGRGEGRGEGKFQIFLVKCQAKTSARVGINVPELINLIKGIPNGHISPPSNDGATRILRLLLPL